MANEYMVNASDVLSIANAIREKGGITEGLAFPDDFVTSIESIPVGGELNFTVIGGNPQPQNPKENTIWVDTDQEITGWVFDFNEPSEPAEGMVWFCIGKDSRVGFNALKNDGIMLYPILAKQYTGSEWVAVPAKTYQDGAWVDWIRWLYNKGDKCEDITGGWTFDDARNAAGGKGTYTDNGNSITLKSTGRWQSIQAVTNNKIDFSVYDTIKVNVTSLSLDSDTYLWFRYGEVQKMANGISRLTIKSTGVHEIDISSVETGEYYIGLEAYSDVASKTVTATFDTIWME